MKKMICSFLALTSLSAFAQEQFAGKWSSSLNTIRFYSEMGTIDYQACQTNLTIDVQAPTATEKHVSIKNLKTTCSHPSFWDFHQVLPEVTFVVDTKTQVVKYESEKVGTLSDSKMEIKYDIGGQLFFLDAKFNTDGTLHFEWSSRSYETVNFDVINKLKRI
jgi:hypothetical protein